MRFMPSILLGVIWILALGCVDEDAPRSTTEGEAGSETARPGGVPDADIRASEDDDERAMVKEILIRFEGAVGAGPNVTRTVEEAEALAQEVSRLAKSGEAQFDDLVTRYSEGYSKDEAGLIPPFARGTRSRVFEDAAFPMSVGEISDPFRTHNGFHVVKRESGELFVAQLMLIRYAAARDAPTDLTRTREEARALINDLYEQVKATPDRFAQIALRNTEGPNPIMGGNLGTFHRYTYGEFIGDLTASLEPGELSEVFETAQGFQIMKRLK